MAMAYQNFASLGVNLNRQKYGPLDISNVFTSAADLKYYLTKGTFTEGVSEYWYKNADEKIVPYPYEGQVLATVIDGVVNVYALALDAEGNFTTQEIAGKIEVDGKTIKLNADGKLELVGLPEDISGKTLVPSLVNGVLTWAEPDTSTAEGQAQEIEGLKTRAGQLEADLAAEIAAREAAIGAASKPETTEGAGDAVAATGVYAAIEAAEARAKAYADENDANTVYDDTALAARVKAIEDDYLKEEDKYDDSDVLASIAALDEAIGDAEGGLVKDVADNTQAIADEKTRAEAAEKALGERIDAIDFVDGDELEEAIKDFATVAYVDGEVDKIEAAIAALNHFKAEVVDDIDKVTEVGVLYLIKDETVIGTDKYNEYIVVDGVATLIGDTTTDLSNYYNKTEVDGLVETINKAIADETTARGELADRVDALEDADDDLAADIAAVAEDLEAANETLAGKVDSTAFETFKTENTSAIATAKQEAIDEAESKVGALADTVAETYATNDALTEAVEGIENDLMSYAKSADVAADLAKKIETATISHATEDKAEGVTVSGTQLNIVVDAYTKAETLAQIEEILDQINDNSESAASVDTKLANHIKTYEEKVGQIDTKNNEQDAAIAIAQAQADKGVQDAAKVAADLVTANSAIADNTREIGVAKDSITSVNNTLTEKITALEGKDTTIEGNITALQTTVGGHTTTITEQGTKIAALEDKDLALAALIQGNTDKFANYSTTEQVNKAIDDKIAAIPEVDLGDYAKTATVEASIAAVNEEVAKKANAADVYTITAADAKFMTEAQVKSVVDKVVADVSSTDTIEGLVTLVEYVHDNAGDIAKLVSDVATNKTATETNAAAIAQNTSDIVAINEALAAIVQPKSSEEIEVAEDGTLSLGKVSTDRLVQGSDTLVLCGGDAGTKAAE